MALQRAHMTACRAVVKVVLKLLYPCAFATFFLIFQVMKHRKQKNKKRMGHLIDLTLLLPVQTETTRKAHMERRSIEMIKSAG